MCIIPATSKCRGTFIAKTQGNKKLNCQGLISIPSQLNICHNNFVHAYAENNSCQNYSTYLKFLLLLQSANDERGESESNLCFNFSWLLSKPRNLLKCVNCESSISLDWENVAGGGMFWC